MKKWMLIAQLMLAVVVKAESPALQVGHAAQEAAAAIASNVSTAAAKPAYNYSKDVASTIRPDSGVCPPTRPGGSSSPTSSVSSGSYY